MRLHREEGQVIVEQALVLPMMVFLILGIIQLAMIQHARIATEYAAYNAARSGIVYNGDPKMMERAAFLSLLPTFGRADDLTAIGPTLFRAAATQLGSDLADALGLDLLTNVKMVQVEILDHPTVDRMAIMDQQRHLNKQQIDFDDWRTQPAIANQLTVHVRYYYKMVVPFANWFLQYMWLAQRTGTMSVAYGGKGVAFLNPKTRFQNKSSHAEIKKAALMLGDDESIAVMAYRAKGDYRIPINTFYTMRMQSNLYKAYLGN